MLECDAEKGAGLVGLDEKRCGHPVGGAGTAHAMRVVSPVLDAHVKDAPRGALLRLRGAKLAVERLYL